jgi:hypothetical protein
MFGAVLMKRGKDGKDRLINEEDVKPQTADGYVGAIGKLLEENGESSLSNLLGGFRIEMIGNLLARPKTYERLVSDLYTAGWTIDEVKTLLNGGKIEEMHD